MSTLLPNGPVMLESGILFSHATKSGDGQPVRQIVNPFGGGANNPFKIPLRVAVKGGSAGTANRSHSVMLQEINVAEYKSNPSFSYPWNWSPANPAFDFPNNVVIGSVMSDGDGNIPDFTTPVFLTPSFFNQNDRLRTEGTNENFDWASGFGGQFPDPNARWRTKCEEFESPQPFILDAEGQGQRLVWATKQQFVLTLRIYDGLGYSSNVNVTMEVALACEVDRWSQYTAIPPTAATGLLDIPVDFNGDANQFWTPVLDRRCNQPVDSEPFGYTDLIKRDFATADTRNLHIHTLEIFCEGDPLNETYFLCNDTQSHELTVDGVPQTFQAANFNFTLPQTTEDSTPEMQLTISNVDGAAGEYIDRVRGYGTVAVRYRVYLASAPTQAQNPNPLTLYLTECNVDMFQISGRLSLTDSLDARFPAENYNVKNFPNIFG